MRQKTLQTALILAFLAVHSHRLLADVGVTEPIGGENVSADKAQNSTNGAGFVSLGNIVLTEAASSDFAPGANLKLILSAPDGWRFSPGIGSVSFQGSRDISAATILVTSSNLTVTYSVGGTTKFDVLTISGVQVQPLNGADGYAGYILRLSANAGTGVIAGIDNDLTTFGLLYTNPGAAKALAIQTQPGASAIAGTLFNPQPEVGTIDQFGNACFLDDTTVVTAAVATGNAGLLGTLQQTVMGGTAYFTNLSANIADTITIRFTATNCNGVVSAPIVITPATVLPADHLVFAVQPGAAIAGAPFGVQPVIRAQDGLGNFTAQGLGSHHSVALTLTSGSGTILGTTTLDIGTSGGNGTVSFTDLEIDMAATNYQLTASSAGLASTSSTVFTVSPGALVKLQLLMPGEIAAPATPTGKAGVASPQTAGTPFNATINAADAYWNVIKTVTDTIGIGSSDNNAALPANAALINGTKTMSVTLKTTGSATITANDIANSSITGSTSPSIAVNAGAFAKLQILAPGETAAPGTATGKTGTAAVQTAGTTFNVAINAVDANWNRISTINDVVGLTCSDVNAGLDANAALSGGTTTLSVMPRTAGSTTVTATDITDAAKTANTTPGITVAAGPFARLQLLVPGELPAPGTSTGKTGVPLQQMAGENFVVKVNAVDSNWNKVATATDLISVTSSDMSAVLPANSSLVAATQSLNVTFNTPGSATITASDASDNSKIPATSTAITIAPALYAEASGGEAISADSTGGIFTTLTGPFYTEVTNGNVGTGTIILKAPAGFIFNTASPLPTVLINGPGSKTYNINGVVNGTAAAMTSVSTTQLVFTITKKSSGGFPGKLTWQNVKVRPTAGTPLAMGNLSFAGTASLLSVTTNSRVGLLREIPGAANKFAIQVQPSATATAGVALVQQPVLQILDKFGNLRTNDSATVVTASRSTGSGTLQGHISATASAGIAAFSDLTHNVATNITILFSSPGVTNATSSTIAISAAAATSLAFAVQPGNATAGSVFGVQPVILTVDDFGNFSTLGLANSLNTVLSLNSGTGPLQGTLIADIGTSAGNGRISFNNLRLDTAGANQQLKASANGLVKVNSSLFAVNAAAASQLVIQTQPSSAAQAGVAFPQQPALLVQDVFGNLRTADNSTVVTVSRNAGSGTLLGTKTATAIGGIATFANLSYTNVETINLTFSSGGLAGANSTSIVVGPGPARKLIILRQPSSTATAGQTFAQQPQVGLQDQFGNLCSSDNSTVVGASRGSGTGTLLGTTTATASGGTVTFTDLSYPVAETMKVLFTSTSLTNALSGNVAVSSGAFTKLLILTPGESAAPGTATGKTGSPTNPAPDTAFNVTLSAVDDNWNLVNTATDTIAFSSSDIFATLPTNTPLAAGTRQFSVRMSEAGTTNTVTATDLTDSSKAVVTVAIPVVARYVSAAGGNAIPASTAGGAFNSLIGPTYSEKASGEVGKGTIILNAPTGFIFDIGGVAPAVRIDRISATGRNPANINNVVSGAAVPMTSVNSTQLTFTVSTASSGATCKLTWQNVRVRPTASNPLAIGKITKAGTSAMAGVTNSVSNLGTLREILDTPMAMAQTVPVSGASDSTLSSTSAEGQSTSVNLNVSPSTSSSSTYPSAPATMTGITTLGGAIRITFIGAPGYTYQVERASALGASASWQAVGSVTADSLGHGAFIDSNPLALQGFYRTSQ